MDSKEGFNKLQYSKFVGQDQFVVRSNDKTEFMELVAFIDDFVTKLPKEKVATPIKQEASKTCPKCGSVMIEGRNGKPYCKPCYIAWKKENEGKSY